MDKRAPAALEFWYEFGSNYSYLEEAIAVIGRIVVRIESMRIGEVDPELRIAFSAGVAASRPNERFDEAIRRADEAMYRAKENGRNCVLAA